MTAQDKIKVDVGSEVGELEAVIIHTPGPEVENMTPSTAERALYSDILNLSVASKEYSQFKNILERYARTFEVKDLLSDIIKNEQTKTELIKKITSTCKLTEIYYRLMKLSDKELITQLIEGVLLEKNNLTSYLSKNNYIIEPLHNFFFSRDPSFVINSDVFIGKMAKKVRIREAIIMESIFKNHPLFETKTNSPGYLENDGQNITIEGGDIIVVDRNTLLIGIGARTTTQGVDYIINQLKEKEEIKHIIIQELPHTPESFVHIDMVVTFLDVNTCIIYEPLIFNGITYNTVLITIDNKKVKKIETLDNIIVSLKNIGKDIKFITCGDKKDKLIQEREQWHSGTNFFTISPGRVIGYERNTHTSEELNRQGYEVIRAKDALNGQKELDNYDKWVVTIEGGELARGGGGPRCMTLPVRRKPL